MAMTLRPPDDEQRTRARPLDVRFLTARERLRQRSGTAKRLVTTRARIVSSTTRTISVRAAPQARSWAPGKGSWALRKIWVDSAVLAPWKTAVLTLRAAPMV